jgi:hypothetical protein
LEMSYHELTKYLGWARDSKCNLCPYQRFQAFPFDWWCHEGNCQGVYPWYLWDSVCEVRIISCRMASWTDAFQTFNRFNAIYKDLKRSVNSRVLARVFHP